MPLVLFIAGLLATVTVVFLFGWAARVAWRRNRWKAAALLVPAIASSAFMIEWSAGVGVAYARHRNPRSLFAANFGFEAPIDVTNLSGRASWVFAVDGTTTALLFSAGAGTRNRILESAPWKLKGDLNLTEGLPEDLFRVCRMSSSVYEAHPWHTGPDQESVAVLCITDSSGRVAFYSYEGTTY